MGRWQTSAREPAAAGPKPVRSRRARCAARQPRDLTAHSVSLRESDSAFPAGEAHPAAGDADAMYSRVADLPLRIERCELVPLVRDTSSGFTKVSIVVRLTGDGHEGQGEDITWDQIDQIEQLRRAGDLSWLRGRRTFDEFSTLLGLADLFPVEPIRESARNYRHWAFESAALDLALRQSGLSLQDAVGRAAQPVTFVVSTRIADSSGLAALRALGGMDPALRFKLDPMPSWDDALLAELASVAGVEVVDMKGLYRNATVAMEPDLDLYRRVFEALPEAWIEDPAVADDNIELLERHRERITWDVPIRSVGDIEALPWRPRLLNLKPARFGSVRRLFETYDYCEVHGICAYGGGMFEQGPGRGHLQYLASLFHPDGPNDLAPVEYNLQLGAGDLPRSPLPPEPHGTGFRWGSYDARRSVRERLPQ
jgi:L-alanine-DL-glutamate epimerase-like enolase superfamily enzyme